MAHKGKRWPVLYRRDMNLNVSNNSIGWARRYLTFITWTSSGPGQRLSGFEFDCGPDEYPAIDKIVWRSGFVSVGIDRWQLTLTSQIVGGKRFKRTAVYELALYGRVLELFLFAATDPDHSGFLQAGQCRVDFWDDNFFDFAPVLPLAFPFEKRWTDGAPH